jgi:hypothetical protein
MPMPMPMAMLTPMLDADASPRSQSNEHIHAMLRKVLMDELLAMVIVECTPKSI